MSDVKNCTQHKNHETLQKSAQVKSTHDKMFRGLMQRVHIARDFFKHILPKSIMSKISLSGLQIMKDNSINGLSSREYRNDIVYVVKDKNQQDGFLILTEHQSNDYVFMGIRIWNYVFHILMLYIEQHPNVKQLPFVITVIYFSGKKPYRFSTDVVDCFADQTMAKQFLFKPITLFDVNKVSDKDIAKHKDNLANSMLLAHKHIYDSDLNQTVKLLAKDLRNLQNFDNKRHGNYIRILLKYLVDNSKVKNAKEFVRKLFKILSEGEQNMGTVADYFREQGREKGIEQGMEQGVEKGMKIAAKKLLQKNQDIDFVSDVTGLPVDVIYVIKRKLGKSS